MRPRLRPLRSALIAGAASLALLALPAGAPAEPAKKLLPKFDLKTLEGERLSSSALRGKVVLLDFWGTWCPPCVSAVPSLRELNQSLKGEPFVLVSIAVEENDAPVRRFVKKHRMDWPQVWDSSAVFSRQSNVSRFPTYILVSHDGYVLQTVVGTSRGVERDLRNQVVKAVADAKKAAPGAA